MSHLLGCYQALEKASADMLGAARQADWERVVKLADACALLIAELKQAATSARLAPAEMQAKGRLMQRILRNDAEIRHLAEPWLGDLSRLRTGATRTLH